MCARRRAPTRLTGPSAPDLTKPDKALGEKSVRTLAFLTAFVQHGSSVLVRSSWSYTGGAGLRAVLSRVFAGGVFRGRRLRWTAAAAAGILLGAAVQPVATAQGSKTAVVTAKAKAAAVTQAADTTSAVLAARKQKSKVEILG